MSGPWAAKGGWWRGSLVLPHLTASRESLPGITLPSKSPMSESLWQTCWQQRQEQEFCESSPQPEEGPTVLLSWWHTWTLIHILKRERKCELNTKTLRAVVQWLSDPGFSPPVPKQTNRTKTLRVAFRDDVPPLQMCPFNKRKTRSRHQW